MRAGGLNGAGTKQKIKRHKWCNKMIIKLWESDYFRLRITVVAQRKTISGDE